MVSFIWHSEKNKTTGTKIRWMAGCQELDVEEGRITTKGIQGNFLMWQKCSISQLWWWLYDYTFVKPKKNYRGLPWWLSGWESACQCRGHGFEPWSGKIPHAAEQLGPSATTTEPARLEPVLRNKRGRDSERPTHRDEEWPPLAATRESPRTETKTQHSHK